VDSSGTVHTPPLSSPILSGITRDTVIRLLRDGGKRVDEDTFTRDALYVADEVFLTGTAAEVTPVREVDRRPVGLSVPGHVTQYVQEGFFRAVRGQDARYGEWLSYV
jgi:branched-chain amino acid aminotransferase